MAEVAGLGAGQQDGGVDQHTVARQVPSGLPSSSYLTARAACLPWSLIVPSLSSCSLPAAVWRWPRGLPHGTLHEALEPVGLAVACAALLVGLNLLTM
jgi:hypothetical protein